MNPNSVAALIREPLIRQCHKHGLAANAEDYADDHINALSNVELLAAISDAIDTIFAQLKASTK
jgi:hypothetical protein